MVTFNHAVSSPSVGQSVPVVCSSSAEHDRRLGDRAINLHRVAEHCVGVSLERHVRGLFIVATCWSINELADAAPFRSRVFGAPFNTRRTARRRSNACKKHRLPSSDDLANRV